MKKYIPALITGLAVTVLLSFGFGFLRSISGASAGPMAGLAPMIFGALVAFIMANLVGTKLSKAATPADKAVALSLSPPPGQAQLIVFREGFVGKAAGLNVSLDDHPFAQLKSPRFTSVSIPPGPHKLATNFGGLAASQNRGAEEDFVVAAGEVAVFRLTMSMGMMKNTLKIDRIDPPTAVDKLKGITMVMPHAS